MALIHNLYPPVLKDVAPAFIRTQGCKIYFSLSRYNTGEDIKWVQVTVTNLKNNLSILDTTNYPSAIKICSKLQDISPEDYTEPYYIQILPNDIQGGNFEIDQFYKVQLRFVSSNIPEDPPAIGRGLDNWLYTYTDYFSQWSNVCLIKGIAQPHISIEGFDQNQESSFPNYLTEIVGKLYYSEEDKNEKETLKSYNIKIFERFGSQNIIFRSEQQYTNSLYPNEFNYTINQILDTDISYVMQFNYTTNNLYTQTLSYNFIITKQEYGLLDADLTITPKEENGSIEVFIDFNQKHNSTKQLIIKRASSRNNFSRWENLKTIKYEILNKNGYIWYDTTIESGVWYKYLIQQKTDDGRLNCAIESEEPVMCLFEDIFLTQGNKQLKIKFNPSISGLKYNTNLSQQVTLGSQYPFIRKNGNNFYRSFSIGGLISSFMDNEVWNKPVYYNGQFISLNPQDEEAFTTKSQIYGLSKDLYEQYNNQLNISEHQDYIYEREFRNKVCEFLYEYNVKLFRSLTEGNILIKLMDVSFEPITTLGRRLYSFTATAIEIDDYYLLSNLIKYHTVNKYYYSLREQELIMENNDYFIPFESLFQKIYNEHLKNNQKLLNISKITIEPTRANQVVYIKKSNADGYIRLILQSTTSCLWITEGSLIVLNDILRASKGQLLISSNNILSLEGQSHFINDVTILGQLQSGITIDDFYFGGFYLGNENNNLVYENTQYETLENITNPQVNHVYKVAAVTIDNYESLVQNNLITYEQQVNQQNHELEYSLIAEETYDNDNRYIYYQIPGSNSPQWYRFNKYGDIIIPNQGTITYYCKIKEEGDE